MIGYCAGAIEVRNWPTLINHSVCATFYLVYDYQMRRSCLKSELVCFGEWKIHLCTIHAKVDATSRVFLCANNFRLRVNLIVRQNSTLGRWTHAKHCR